MVEKSSIRVEAGKKAARTRRLGRRVATMPIRWVESGEKLENLGHGVQFFHDELRHKVAFLEEFGWLHEPGSPATVRILSVCPDAITDRHWSEILRSACEAVVVFLSSDANWAGKFRHGPMSVCFNA
jgi:hypothetical protein